MSIKIIPTVGRSLHYYPDATESVRHVAGQPLLCLLCGVLSERFINVALYDMQGNIAGGRQGVYLVQEGEDKPNHSYAAWIPFQVERVKATPVLATDNPTSQPAQSNVAESEQPDNIVERGFDLLSNFASRALGLATGLRAARDAGQAIKAGTGEIKGNDLDKAIAVLDAVTQVVPQNQQEAQKAKTTSGPDAQK